MGSLNYCGKQGQFRRNTVIALNLLLWFSYGVHSKDQEGTNDLCPSGKVIDPARKVCQKHCSDGYFKQYGMQVCKACDSPCLTCSNLSKCTSCQNGLYMSNETCVHPDQCKFLQLMDPEDIRLVNGSNAMEGRVEIKIDGLWGTVCDDLWSKASGDVVCKMLNMGQVVEVFANSFFGAAPNRMPILLDDVRCDGTEKRLDECFHGGVGIHDCSHIEDAGVKCSGPNFKKSCVTKCADGYYAAGNKCLPCSNNCLQCHQTESKCTSCKEGTYLEGFKCVSKCMKGRYEDKETGQCQMCKDASCEICEADIRGSKCILCFSHSILTNGKCKAKCGDGEVFQPYTYITLSRSRNFDFEQAEKSEGSSVLVGGVEFITEFGAVTICDDGWDINDAHVICRQMGLLSAVAATRHSTFSSSYDGRENVRYDLSNFQCTGEESSILDCPNKAVAQGKCRWGERAGVICKRRLRKAPHSYRCLPSCYQGFFEKNKKCTFCSTECLTCEGQFDHCTACKEPFYLSKSKCVLHCGIFEYGNTKTRTCLPCNRTKCGTCADGDRDDRCWTCDEPFVLSNSQCLLKCENGLLAKEGECVKECGIGFYQSESKCIKCPKGCLACKIGSDSKVECILCLYSMVLNEDRTCSPNCPSPTFEKVITLPYSELDFQVKIGGGGSTGLVLLKKGSRWVPLCGLGIKNEEKKVICKELGFEPPDPYVSSHSSDEPTLNASVTGLHVEKLRCFGNEKSVAQCMQSEVQNGACHGEILRVECKGSLPKVCQSQCPTGYTHSLTDRKCIKCYSVCKVCHGLPYNCSVCREDRVLHDNRCLLNCPQSTVEDIATRTCKPCGPNCVACDETNPRHCRACKAPYFLNKGSCTESCSGGYKVSLSKHLEMITDSYGHSDMQFYLKIRYAGKSGMLCAEGLSPGLNENDGAVICRELHAGLPIIEAAYSQPVKVDSPVWLRKGHCNGNESSILHCGWLAYKENFYCTKIRIYCTGPDLSRVCLDSCPEGYTILPGKICQQCHPSCKTCNGNYANCTTCTTGYYMSATGKCERDCPFGFYGNEDGQCKPCHSSCASCSRDPTTCTGCKKREFLQKGKCVASCDSGLSAKGTPSLTLVPWMGRKVPIFKPPFSGTYLPICAPVELDVAKVRVVCRNLGYGDVFVFGVTGLGERERSKHLCWSLAKINCSGLENSLEQCNYYENISLSSSKDVVNVACTGGALIKHCTDKCNDGFFVASGKCKPCALRCKTCTNSGDKCNSCRSPFYLDNSTCVTQCRRGFHGNTNSRSCERCADTCSTCVNGNVNTFCTACKAGYIMYKGMCVSKRKKNTVLVKNVLKRFWKEEKLRLVDSRTNSSSEGYLQVFHDGAWGFVCSKYRAIAYLVGDIMCFELGYKGFDMSGYWDSLDRKNVKRSVLGKIWMDIIGCHRHIGSIFSCQHSGWGVSSCSHADDIYLKCESERSEPDDYDYYEDLNGGSCLSKVFSCPDNVQCLDFQTEGGKNDSVCLKCHSQLTRGKTGCLVIANELVSFKRTLEDRTVKEGDFVKLTCEPYLSLVDRNLGDDPRDLIQWEKDGRLLKMIFPQSYGTNPEYSRFHYSLQFTASAKTAGRYSCLLKTTAGILNSTMLLTVRGKPIISSANSVRHAKLNNAYTLSCQSPDQVSWTWFFKDKLVTGSRYDTSKEGYLTVRELQTSDVGQYKCVANNSVGQAEALVQIGLAVTIDVVDLPQYILLKEKGNAKLHCKVQANGPVKIIWKFWGEHLPLSEKYSVSRVIPGLLKINNAGLAQQGIYTCVVISNSMVVSRNIKVLIEGNPYIYQPPKDVNAIRTAIVEFHCLAIGLPPLSYTWLRDNIVIPKDDPHARFLQGGSVLKLLYVHQDQSAVYTCRVTNQIGKDQRGANLVVLEVDLNTGQVKTPGMSKQGKNKFAFPSFGDAIFQVVFGPILAILVLSVIVWCVCKARKRRRTRVLGEDPGLAAQRDETNGSFAVKYHVPSRIMDIVEEEEDEECDEYDETLEVLRYDIDDDLEKKRLVGRDIPS